MQQGRDDLRFPNHWNDTVHKVHCPRMVHPGDDRTRVRMSWAHGIGESMPYMMVWYAESFSLRKLHSQLRKCTSTWWTGDVPSRGTRWRMAGNHKLHLLTRDFTSSSPLPCFPQYVKMKVSSQVSSDRFSRNAFQWKRERRSEDTSADNLYLRLRNRQWILLRPILIWEPGQSSVT